MRCEHGSDMRSVEKGLCAGCNEAKAIALEAERDALREQVRVLREALKSYAEANHRERHAGSVSFNVIVTPWQRAEARAALASTEPKP